MNYEPDDDQFEDEMAEAREIMHMHRCRMRDMRDGIPEWMWSGSDGEDRPDDEETL